MRSTSKVVKYVAIALGLILAIFIISVIVKTALSLFGAFGHFGNLIFLLDIWKFKRAMFLRSKVTTSRVILLPSKRLIP